MDHKTKLEKKISLKLLTIIIIISTSFTLFVSVYQIYFDYKNEVEEIDSRIDFLMNSYLHAITTSIYILDNNLLDALLNGSVNNPDISYIEIYDNKDRLSIAKGSRTDSDKIVKEYELLYETYDSEINLGKLIIYANFDRGYHNLEKKVSIIVISNILKILLVSILIMIAIDRFVVKHINKISNFASNINIKNLKRNRLVLDRKVKGSDEFDVVTSSINNMLTNIREDTQKINLMNSEIAKNEKLLLAMADNFPNSYIFIIDSDFKVRFASGKEYLKSNMDPQKHIGQDVEQLFTESALVKSYFEKSFSGSEESFELLLNGEYKTYSSVPIIYEGGEISSILVVVENITERRVAEELLFQEKERLLVTLRSIGDGVITLNTKGEVVLFNKVAEEITGVSSKDITGKNISNSLIFYDITTEARSYLPIEKMLKDRTVSTELQERKFIDKDGNEKILEDRVAPILNRENSIIGVVIVLRDITEYLKNQEHQQRSAKLEAVGTLAGGIAHDFNNLLSVIMGNISVLMLEIDEHSKHYPTLDDILRGAKQAQKLTQQLLTFTKGGAPIKKVMNINSVIREASNFVTRGSRIECKYNLDTTLPHINIDEGQIYQAITNLIINGSQAMPDGGEIYVSSTIATADDSYINDSSKQYVKISIKDSGYGISSENQKRIFDPYFTTKKTGSGLGLATTFSIIKQHGGNIFLESDLGFGTTFYIYLPIEIVDVEQKVEKGEVRKSSTTKREGRVLLLDDQESILKMNTVILKKLGMETSQAKDGEEAIELFKRSLEENNPYDLLILDLTIPNGMGGLETLSKILKIDENVKAIVSSGYSNDPVMASYEDYGFSGVLVKPSTANQMHQAVEKVLGAEEDV